MRPLQRGLAIPPNCALSPDPPADERRRTTLVVRNRQHRRPLSCRLLARLTRALLRDWLEKDCFELAVYLVGAEEITRLNERFLRHQGRTDVITFDYRDPACPQLLVGEIFVCVDEALAQAARFRTTWQSEVLRYVAHGILHLCGYDDRTPAARRRMKRAENRLVRQLTARFPVRTLV